MLSLAVAVGTVAATADKRGSRQRRWRQQRLRRRECRQQQYLHQNNVARHAHPVCRPAISRNVARLPYRIGPVYGCITNCRLRGGSIGCVSRLVQSVCKNVVSSFALTKCTSSHLCILAGLRRLAVRAGLEEGDHNGRGLQGGPGRRKRQSQHQRNGSGPLAQVPQRTMQVQRETSSGRLPPSARGTPSAPPPGWSARCQSQT